MDGDLVGWEEVGEAPRRSNKSVTFSEKDSIVYEDWYEYDGDEDGEGDEDSDEDTLDALLQGVDGFKGLSSSLGHVLPASELIRREFECAEQHTTVSDDDPDVGERFRSVTDLMAEVSECEDIPEEEGVKYDFEEEEEYGVSDFEEEEVVEVEEERGVSEEEEEQDVSDFEEEEVVEVEEERGVFEEEEEQDVSDFEEEEVVEVEEERGVFEEEEEQDVSDFEEEEVVEVEEERGVFEEEEEQDVSDFEEEEVVEVEEERGVSEEEEEQDVSDFEEEEVVEVEEERGVFEEEEEQDVSDFEEEVERGVSEEDVPDFDTPIIVKESEKERQVGQHPPLPLPSLSFLANEWGMGRAGNAGVHLASTRLLRQYLDVLTMDMAQIRERAEALGRPACAPPPRRPATYQYTTLQATNEFIRRHRPRVRSMEEALAEVRGL